MIATNGRFDINHFDDRIDRTLASAHAWCEGGEGEDIRSGQFTKPDEAWNGVAWTAHCAVATERLGRNERSCLQSGKQSGGSR